MASTTRRIRELITDPADRPRAAIWAAWAASWAARAASMAAWAWAISTALFDSEADQDSKPRAARADNPMKTMSLVICTLQSFKYNYPAGSTLPGSRAVEGGPAFSTGGRLWPARRGPAPPGSRSENLAELPLFHGCTSGVGQTARMQ